jgi:hypothetical protein
MRGAAHRAYVRHTVARLSDGRCKHRGYTQTTPCARMTAYAPRTQHEWVGWRQWWSCAVCDLYGGCPTVTLVTDGHRSWLRLASVFGLADQHGVRFAWPQIMDRVVDLAASSCAVRASSWAVAVLCASRHWSRWSRHQPGLRRSLTSSRPCCARGELPFGTRFATPLGLRFAGGDCAQGG